MKKLILFILILLAVPFSVGAVSVGWDRYIVGGLRTLYGGDKVLIGATATTSTANLEVKGNQYIYGTTTGGYALTAINNSTSGYGVYGYVNNSDAGKYLLKLENTFGNVFSISNNDIATIGGDMQLYQDSFGFMHMQHGSGNNSILILDAPVADPQEATLSLRRDLTGAGTNLEYTDYVDEDYGVDHLSTIDVTKIGTGKLRPFAVRFYDRDCGTIQDCAKTAIGAWPSGLVAVGAGAVSSTTNQTITDSVFYVASTTAASHIRVNGNPNSSVITWGSPTASMSAVHVGSVNTLTFASSSDLTRPIMTLDSDSNGGAPSVSIFSTTSSKFLSIFADSTLGGMGLHSLDSGGSSMPLAMYSSSTILGFDDSLVGTPVTIGGNVNIGSASFSSLPLTVVGTAQASVFRTSNVGTASAPTYIFSADVNTGMYKNGSGDINRLGFSTNGIGALFIDENQHVGVGTSTPTGSFHVSAGASATTTVSFGAIGDTSSKTCFNVKNASGANTSFFFRGTTMVIEANLCR